jgi:hypothetical protein
MSYGPSSSSTVHARSHASDHTPSGYIPGFYVPATPAQVSLDIGQQRLREQQAASRLFGPSPALMVESKRARKYWLLLLIVRLATLAFSIVELVLMLTMYYRIPTLGNTCQFNQNYRDPAINPNSHLAIGVGLLACRLGIAMPSVSFPILLALMLLLVLFLCKIFTFYQYAILLNLLQLILIFIIFGVWLFVAIYLLTALVNTCANQVCSDGLWPHQKRANWIVIFAWIISLFWVSHLKGYNLKKKISLRQEKMNEERDDDNLNLMFICLVFDSFLIF